MIDLLFCGKGRSEFTRASGEALRKNTDMTQARLCLYHDGARPPEFDISWAQHQVVFWGGPTMWDGKFYGGPVACLVDLISDETEDIIAKIDNDVIVPPGPPGWLEQCLAVMEAHPELDLLGIEPPQSRTIRPGLTATQEAKIREAAAYHWPENFHTAGLGYCRTDHIGGIGLFRRRAFDRFPDLRPEGNVYGGFTSWQLRHPELVIGWLVPPLKLFLLDRLPFEPWASLSRHYIAEGQQRPWTNYSPEVARELAGWWLDEKAAIRRA